MSRRCVLHRVRRSQRSATRQPPVCRQRRPSRPIFQTLIQSRIDQVYQHHLPLHRQQSQLKTSADVCSCIQTAGAVHALQRPLCLLGSTDTSRRNEAHCSCHRQCSRQHASSRALNRVCMSSTPARGRSSVTNRRPHHRLTSRLLHHRLIALCTWCVLRVHHPVRSHHCAAVLSRTHVPGDCSASRRRLRLGAENVPTVLSLPLAACRISATIA